MSVCKWVAACLVFIHIAIVEIRYMIVSMRHMTLMQRLKSVGQEPGNYDLQASKHLVKFGKISCVL